MPERSRENGSAQLIKKGKQDKPEKSNPAARGGGVCFHVHPCCQFFDSLKRERAEAFSRFIRSRGACGGVFAIRFTNLSKLFW